MLRALLFVAFVAASGGSVAQSQQPSPNASQQNANQQERGTEKAPIVVKVLPAEKSKGELDSEIAKQESDRQLVKLTGDLAKYTRLLFVATGLLVLVTGGLMIVGFFQVSDAKKSIAAAVKSANAAEKSAESSLLTAKAAIGAELPIIGLSHFGLARKVSKTDLTAFAMGFDEALPPISHVEINFTNGGRSMLRPSPSFLNGALQPSCPKSPFMKIPIRIRLGCSSLERIDPIGSRCTIISSSCPLPKSKRQVELSTEL